MLAQRADGVIVTNRRDETEISNLTPRIPNLVRIPIGSNIAPRLPDGYSRDAWRAQLGIGVDDLLLGYFGFLNERKGGKDLIETLALLVSQGYPANLLLIGGQVGSSDPTNAAYAERVDRLITERGLVERVHRTGQPGRDRSHDEGHQLEVEGIVTEHPGPILVLADGDADPPGGRIDKTLVDEVDHHGKEECDVVKVEPRRGWVEKVGSGDALQADLGTGIVGQLAGSDDDVEHRGRADPQRSTRRCR